MKSLILARFFFLVAFTAGLDLSAQVVSSQEPLLYDKNVRPRKGPRVFKLARPGAWQVFAPGKLPVGKILTGRDAMSLPAGDYSTERLYLVGSFVVTASGEGRALMRPIPKQGACCLIVEYPPQIPPPAVGTNVTRDELRGFQIREVRLGVDQTVNVYVREITLP